MINTQLLSDKFAIGLSVGCALHCLLLPSFLILASGFITFTYHDELMHFIILLFAVPISIFALYQGLKNHQQYLLFAVGLIGLACLISAVLLSETFFISFSEKALTLLGSTIVTLTHLRNYQVCKKILCECHEAEKVI